MPLATLKRQLGDTAEEKRKRDTNPSGNIVEVRNGEYIYCLSHMEKIAKYIKMFSLVLPQVLK